MKNFILSNFFISHLVFAHGGAKLGPHGGYLKMPGSFHTELLETGDGFRVWLLDVNFKNPVVLKSSVKLTLREVATQTNIECIIEKDYFNCPYKRERSIIKTIEIGASRNLVSASKAIYNYPLRLETM